MTGLRAVPDSPMRAVLYLRQSTARDDSISLELQEIACRDYAARCGYTIVAVEADPGVSGRTFKRAAVTRVMDMIEAGRADIIVLWKWSRLSRSRRDWAVAVDRVEVAGGRIESATETVDVSTSTGRLARGVLAEFAAFESDRIGEVWREVHARRVAAGLPPTGKPKWGYVYDTGEKLHRPDPVLGPVLAQLYRRYIAGESFYSLTRWLNTEGHRTLADGQWRDNVLRTMLDAGFGAGQIRYHGQTHPGIHEPVIDPDTWQAYLDARAGRRHIAPRSKHTRYLLTGLVRCGRCGGRMYGGQYGGARQPKYRCVDGRQLVGAGRCTGGYVLVHLVEAQVLDWLRGPAVDVEEASRAADVAESRRLVAAADETRLLRDAARLDDALTRLTVQLAEGLVPEQAYADARDELEDRRRILLEKAEQAGRDLRAAGLDTAAVAGGLMAEWDTLGLEHRRELLRQLVAEVRVWTGRPLRVEVVPTWGRQD